MSGYAWALVTLLLTVYGQLIVKWRVDEAGDLPAGIGGKVEYLARLAVSPWIITVFLAAFVAALAWFAAVSQLELSRAYPVMGLSFVLIVISSAVLFGEELTVWKVVGVVMIAGGVLVATQRWTG